MALLATGFRRRCPDAREYRAGDDVPVLALVFNPSTDSYERLVQGFESR